MVKIINLCKKVLWICLLMFIVTTCNCLVYGIDISAADQFIDRGKNPDPDVISLSSEDLKTIGNEFSELGKIITFIGAGIIVGATAYMGIQYLVSSPDKQAKLKQQLVGLVVAAIVIFGAYGIWSLIITVLDSLIG